MLPYFVLQTPVPIRHTNTHFNTEPVQGVGHAAAAATATKAKKAQVAFRKKKKKEFVGYYFGLWARCLSDELKKKICNDCHVASPALVGEKKSHLSRSTEAGNAVWLPQRPTSDSEDRRWRCCSWGQTLTHSNAAEPTPPDRWNVKTGLAGVRLGGFVTCLRYNPTHTEIRNHKLAIERTIFMATHSTNSTLLTIHDMRNLT